MSSQENKIELSLDLADAARFFRKFADALENGDEKALNKFGVSIRDSQKIKLRLKRDTDSVDLKIKIANPQSRECVCGEAGSPEAAGQVKESYKSLKKRLEKAYKNIRKDLLAAQPPDQGDLAIFLEDSTRLANWPGYGDEYYSAYANACSDFEKAVAAGAQDEMLDAFKKIGEVKSSCHDRYK